MSKPVLSDLDLGGTSRLLNLPAPASPNEPARKADLDAAIEGVAWKDSVRVKTVANLNLAAPGATIDGVTMAVSDRVLVGSQTAAAENGVSIWNGAGVPMTRAADCSTADELEQAIVTVEEGTSAGTSWRQTAVNFVLGTGAVAWTVFGQVSPASSESTAGVIRQATQAETDAGAAGLSMSPERAKAASWAAKRYAADLGDNSATQFTITHNLGTRDLVGNVRRNSGNYDQVLVDIDYLTTNTARVTFATAPTAAQYRLILVG